MDKLKSGLAIKLDRIRIKVKYDEPQSLTGRATPKDVSTMLDIACTDISNYQTHRHVKG